jgi:hypothetical protein
MLIQPNDILLAFKAIALSERINGAEKQFAAFLIDSFNRKTGRCDPSEETAAFILGKSKRTIVRAGNRLIRAGFFQRRRHAGHNHCNSYLPNWELFRKLESKYKDRRKQRAKRFAQPKLSPPERQPCHFQGARPVTQTSPTNNIPSTYLDVPSDLRRAALSSESKIATPSIPKNQPAHHASFSPSSREAAEAAAVRRWNQALLDQFLGEPIYLTIVDTLDSELQAAATEAEMKRRGEGIACILRGLMLRKVLPPTRRYEDKG